MLTEDELISKLREKRFEDPSEVELAHIESNGEFSVVKRADTAVESELARTGSSK